MKPSKFRFFKMQLSDIRACLFCSFFFCFSAEAHNAPFSCFKAGASRETDMENCQSYLIEPSYPSKTEPLITRVCPVKTNHRETYFIYAGDTSGKVGLLCQKRKGKEEAQGNSIPVSVHIDDKAADPDQGQLSVSGGGHDFPHDQWRKKPQRPNQAVFSQGTLSQGAIPVDIIPFAFGLEPFTSPSNRPAFVQHDLLSDNSEILVIDFNGQQRLYRMSPFTGWQLVARVGSEALTSGWLEYWAADNKLTRALAAVFVWLEGGNLKQRPVSGGDSPKEAANSPPAGSNQPATASNNKQSPAPAVNLNSKGSGSGDSEPPAQEGNVCPSCGEYFSTSQLLEQHKKTHDSLSPISFPPKDQEESSQVAEASQTVEASRQDHLPAWPAIYPEMNVLAPGWSPCHYRSLPPTPEPLELLPDEFIQPTRWSADSIDWYWQEVEKRKELEQQGKDYTFEPLRTTLLNMQLLTLHILKDKQFWSPLSKEETAVFNLLKDEIEALLGKPEILYKKTLVLTCKFTFLYDWMVLHKVYIPLGLKLPKDIMYFFDSHSLDDTLNLQFSGPEPSKTLMDLYQKKIWDNLLLQDYSKTPCSFESFFRPLHATEAILYPSYEPLDLHHFNRFGHLPIYPLGMMTSFGQGADGQIRSPLRFYYHDILHLSMQCIHKRVYQADTLCSPKSRFCFRELVLGYIPEEKILESIPVQKAAEVLIFTLYHEGLFSYNMEYFEAKSYVLYMQIIMELAKHSAHALSPDYQQVTVEAAALAAYWTHGLISVWNDNNQQALSRENIVKFNKDIFMPGAEKILSELKWVKENQEQLLIIIPKYLSSVLSGLSYRPYNLKDDGNENLGRPESYNLEQAHLYLLETNAEYKDEVEALGH